jgi:PAS domain S-box-containing protein
MAEKELLLLSDVVRKCDSSVLITDKFGFTLWCNEAFTRTMGYELEDLIGKKPGAMMQCEESDTEVINQIGRSLRTGKPVCVDIVNQRKNGQRHIINLEINPV